MSHLMYFPFLGSCPLPFVALIDGITMGGVSFANSLTLLEYRRVQPMHMLKAWSQPVDFLAFGSSGLSEQRKDSKKLH